MFVTLAFIAGFLLGYLILCWTVLSQFVAEQHHKDPSIDTYSFGRGVMHAVKVVAVFAILAGIAFIWFGL